MLNRAVASRMELNATDIETLGVLAVLGATNPTRLASLLAMGTGSMTLVIDRLERAGFVRRVRDTKDRRSLTVEFVPERRRDIAARIRERVLMTHSPLSITSWHRASPVSSAWIT